MWVKDYVTTRQATNRSSAADAPPAGWGICAVEHHLQYCVVSSVVSASCNDASVASSHEAKASASRPSSTTVAKALAAAAQDRKSTRLNSSHVAISYAVFCLKKKKNTKTHTAYASTDL